MITALYGTLIRHAWHDTDSPPDAYSLFYQRSIAMGWLDDRSAGGGLEDHLQRAPGLWGMNDAGWNHPLAAGERGLISWFQVDATTPADDRPLPVQPFLRCAHDATARAGRMDLSAIKIILPAQGSLAARRPPYAPVPAVLTGPWFDRPDRDATTSIQVILNAGPNVALTQVTAQLVADIGRLEQDVFESATFDITGRDSLPLPPSIDERTWNVPAEHGATLYGELAEWSPDAVGWLAETIADSLARIGVDSSLMITATPVGQAS